MFLIIVVHFRIFVASHLVGHLNQLCRLEYQSQDNRVKTDVEKMVSTYV